MKTFKLTQWIALGTALAAGSALAAVELAKVNGKPITDTDIKMALSGFNEGQRSTILKDPNSRRQILGRRIDQEREYKETMDAFRKQLLANRLVQKNVAAKVSESASKKYYERNKSRFSTDEVHVQHILVGDEGRARELLKQARQPGVDFMELAEKVSADPSAKNNRGDIGLITHDSPFVPAFKDAAFAGKEGEIVGPVKTEYGYHLIKVVKKKIGRPLNYEEVELKVKEALRNELIQDYINNLKKQAKIQIDEKALEKI